MKCSGQSKMNKDDLAVLMISRFKCAARTLEAHVENSCKKDDPPLLLEGCRSLRFHTKQSSRIEAWPLGIIEPQEKRTMLALSKE